jgi:hypothetical protein
MKIRVSRRRMVFREPVRPGDGLLVEVNLAPKP